MTVIRSRRVVLPDGTRPAAIEFEETITQVMPWDATPNAIDYADHVIMPGLVDSHVHVNEPGRTEWEGFETATRAAAAGGITTIVDMPLNSIPATTTVAALETKKRALEGKCHVDVALWGGVVPGNTAELQPMLSAGARGFKCFLVPSGVDEFPHVNAAQLREAARELARCGGQLLAHAELPEPLEEAGRALIGKDPDEYATYLASRPRAAEDHAIALLRDVAIETGAAIHVVHLSSSTAIGIIRDAQQNGARLTAETTPHYLHFEAEAIPHGHREFKCAPPIRERTNREELWRGIADGTISLIVSDHSPCAPELKRGDFMSAWGGISSLQFVLPIIWTEARRRGYRFEMLARWLCAGPAALASLPRKGSIAPGHDADFAIWSPDDLLVVEPDVIEHRHKITPYAGESLYGVVRETWLRGERIYVDREHAPAPRGRWVGNQAS